MIASELLAGLTVVGLVFAHELALMYGLLILGAAFMSIMTPARQAALPDLVARQELTRANALLQQLSGIVKIGAPMLAGALLAVVDPRTAIILDAISFGLSAIILSRLPALPPHGCEGRAEEAEMKSGGPSLIAVVRSLPQLRLLFASMFWALFVIIGIDALAPVYTRDILAGNESLFGMLIGCIGLGTVGAGLVLFLRRGNHRPWNDVVLGMLLLAIIPLSLAGATRIDDPGLAKLLIAAASLVGGIGSGLMSIQAGTLLQLMSPSEVLGRVGGAYQATVVGGQLLGLFITPLLVPNVLSIESYFLINAVGLIAVATFAGVGGRVRHEDPAEAARSHAGEARGEVGIHDTLGSVERVALR